MHLRAWWYKTLLGLFLLGLFIIVKAKVKFFFRLWLLKYWSLSFLLITSFNNERHLKALIELLILIIFNNKFAHHPLGWIVAVVFFVSCILYLLAFFIIHLFQLFLVSIAWADNHATKIANRIAQQIVLEPKIHHSTIGSPLIRQWLRLMIDLFVFGIAQLLEAIVFKLWFNWGLAHWLDTSRRTAININVWVTILLDSIHLDVAKLGCEIIWTYFHVAWGQESLARQSAHDEFLADLHLPFALFRVRIRRSVIIHCVICVAEYATNKVDLDFDIS